MLSERPVIHGSVDEWLASPVPRRLHRCRPVVSLIYAEAMERIDRCACGALRITAPYLPGRWRGRNTRPRTDAFQPDG